MPTAQRHSVDERFERQAGYCASMGSPLSAALLLRAANDFRSGGPVRQLFDAYPQLEPPQRVGIRLLAALHAGALEGRAPSLAAHLPSCGGDGDGEAAWEAARAFLAANVERIATLCERTPQTNEPARSMPLLAGLLVGAAETSLPIRLLEIGASAGLNARLDRYRYEGAGWSWGDAASALTLRNRERRGRPGSLDASLHIEERRACDLHPLDIAREEDRNDLRSFIWPDQLERLKRFDDACAAASRAALVVERADAIAWARERFQPKSGALTVLMHSVFTYYLTIEQREALQQAVADAFAAAVTDAPVAWLRLEEGRHGYETRIMLSPERDIVIAYSDGHAQDITWREAA